MIPLLVAAFGERKKLCTVSPRPHVLPVCGDATIIGSDPISGKMICGDVGDVGCAPITGTIVRRIRFH
jgi:hypothetical protein